jgi:DNA-binding NtrC family response regulator
MYIMSIAPTDREFFRQVAEAAFANPFGADRLKADRRIAGVGKETPASEVVDRMMATVAQRVARLEKEKKADIRLHAGEERELLTIVLLFDAFHRFLARFDELIERQLRAGDTAVPVPFANELIALLGARGYSSQGIQHFLAVFFQLRRAFYFIQKGLVGQSPCMTDLRKKLWDNVFTHDIRWYERFLWDRMEDFSTLLLGETGAGKGAAAAAIGRSGYIPYDDKRGCFAESFTRAYVSVHLSQYPESLIESELFGHRKGAFTGAIEHHEGVFARCSPHGAIFLDEIGDAPVNVQIKLLHVLQERVFCPVGSHEQERFRGRIIAATNRPLQELRKRGAFRDDFYYRLCSDVITVPPLRQRLQEDPAELRRVVAELVDRLTGGPEEDLADSVCRELERQPGRAYAWPGNVRELEQAVRRVLLTRRYEGDIAPSPADLAGALHHGIDTGTLDADDLLSSYCTLLHRRLGTYEAVAERTRLDRRTVRKYIVAHEQAHPRARG